MWAPSKKLRLGMGLGGVHFSTGENHMGNAEATGKKPVKHRRAAMDIKHDRKEENGQLSNSVQFGAEDKRGTSPLDQPKSRHGERRGSDKTDITDTVEDGNLLHEVTSELNDALAKADVILKSGARSLADQPQDGTGTDLNPSHPPRETEDSQPSHISKGFTSASRGLRGVRASRKSKATKFMTQRFTPTRHNRAASNASNAKLSLRYRSATFQGNQFPAQEDVTDEERQIQRASSPVVGSGDDLSSDDDGLSPELEAQLRVVRHFYARIVYSQRGWKPGEMQAIQAKTAVPVSKTRETDSSAKRIKNAVILIQRWYRLRKAMRTIKAYTRIRKQIRELIHKRDRDSIQKGLLLVDLLPRRGGLESIQLRSFKAVLEAEDNLKTSLNAILDEDPEAIENHLRRCLERGANLGYRVSKSDLKLSSGLSDAASGSGFSTPRSEGSGTCGKIIRDAELLDMLTKARLMFHLAIRRRKVREKLAQGIRRANPSVMSEALKEGDELAQAPKVPGLWRIPTFKLDSTQVDTARQIIRISKIRQDALDELMEELTRPRLLEFRPGKFPPLDATTLQDKIKSAKKNRVFKAKTRESYGYKLQKVSGYVLEVRESLCEALGTHEAWAWDELEKKVDKIRIWEAKKARGGERFRGKHLPTIADLPDVGLASSLLEVKKRLDITTSNLKAAVLSNQAEKITLALKDIERDVVDSPVDLSSALYPSIADAKGILKVITVGPATPIPRSSSRVKAARIAGNKSACMSCKALGKIDTYEEITAYNRAARWLERRAGHSVRKTDPRKRGKKDSFKVSTWAARLRRPGGLRPREINALRRKCIEFSSPSFLQKLCQES
ncbi:hypothetical protein AAMO2058_001497900, partial [Amorphochlora amoebiformis]